jgi:rfaE bifunctional protein kinase chain/domain
MHAMPATPTAASLAGLLPALAGQKVLIVGDVMLDHYLVGQVERISPEAPVPVVMVEEERYVLGGAGNVARNIVSLGGAPHLLGICGTDANAERLDEMFRLQDIPASLHRVAKRPTTIKTRVMAQNQQLVRVDHEAVDHAPEACRRALLAEIEERVAEYDTVILSDYGKGLVSEEFLAGLRQIVHRNKQVRLLVDPKTRNFPLYTDAWLLTPNAKEAAEGAGMLGIRERMDVLKAGLAIFRSLRCRHLLITMGPQGMAMFQSPDQVWHIPTVARQVFDVSGAGDTVIATTALATAAGHDLLHACMLANYAAGVVVGEVGTACTTLQEVARAIESNPPRDLVKWLDGAG